MSTDLRVSPNVIEPSWKMFHGHRIVRDGKVTEKSSISSSFRTTWIIFSEAASLYWRQWGNNHLDCAHTSVSLSGLYDGRYVYWFLKTNHALDWEFLQEKHTWKWRIPWSCLSRTVQWSKNLFFIINEIVFLDGVGSFKCSILEWQDWCLQRMLFWSDHKLGIMFESCHG